MRSTTLTPSPSRPSSGRLRRYPDPKRIRLGLDLTQEQFARRFEIALGTLRDWEQNVRLPDSAAKAYLRVIANDPEGVERALARSYRRDGRPPY